MKRDRRDDARRDRRVVLRGRREAPLFHRVDRGVRERRRAVLHRHVGHLARRVDDEDKDDGGLSLAAGGVGDLRVVDAARGHDVRRGRRPRKEQQRRARRRGDGRESRPRSMRRGPASARVSREREPR